MMGSLTSFCGGLAKHFKAFAWRFVGSYKWSDKSVKHRI